MLLPGPPCAATSAHQGNPEMLFPSFLQNHYPYLQKWSLLGLLFLCLVGNYTFSHTTLYRDSISDVLLLVAHQPRNLCWQTLGIPKCWKQNPLCHWGCVHTQAWGKAGTSSPFMEQVVLNSLRREKRQGVNEIPYPPRRHLCSAAPFLLYSNSFTLLLPFGSAELPVMMAQVMLGTNKGILALELL